MTSQWTFNINIDVFLATEVGVVMTLQVKMAFHSWIQSFLTYLNLRLVALYRVHYVEMAKVAQVDWNNCYKELMDSIGGRH